MRIKRRFKEDADLDITSFMNLMIILVPVLLMSMVLARTTVLDLKLPDMADSSVPPTEEPPQQLELIIREDKFEINYPAGIKLKWIEKTPAGDYDYALLAHTKGDYDLGLQIAAQEKGDDFQQLTATLTKSRRFRNGLKRATFTAITAII